MLARTQFKINHIFGFDNIDSMMDEHEFVSIKDNIISSLLTHDAKLVDLYNYHGEIDSHDDTAEGLQPTACLFVDVVFDVPDEMVNDYSNHAKRIGELAADALQDDGMFVSHHWQRDKEEHIGFQSVYA